jgi:hypothetical protein
VFLEKQDAEPFQSRRYRQRERHKMYENNVRNVKLRRDLLNDGMAEALAFEKLAEKKGVGTNSPVLSNGRPVGPETLKVLEMTIDERRKYLEDFLARRSNSSQDSGS